MKPFLSIVACVAAVAAASGAVRAQGAASAGDLAGIWQGMVSVGGTTLRIGLVLTDSGAGGIGATLVSIDQDGARIPVQEAVVDDGTLRLAIPALGGSYEGTVSADRREVSGTLTQGGMPFPLTFVRVERLDDPPSFEAEDHAAVTALVARYFRAFTEKDYGTLRASLQAPFTLWLIGAAPNVIPTLDEAVDLYRGIRDSLDATEYSSSRAVRTIVTPLTAISALADIHWRRDRSDGSLFAEGAEILTVVRTADGWKISGNITRQLSQFGRMF